MVLIFFYYFFFFNKWEFEPEYSVYQTIRQLILAAWAIILLHKYKKMEFSMLNPHLIPSTKYTFIVKRVLEVDYARQACPFKLVLINFDNLIKFSKSGIRLIKIFCIILKAPRGFIFARFLLNFDEAFVKFE